MSVIEINDSEFDHNISETKGKVLVDCYATWCGPCKMISPIIDELANEINTCTFYKIDVDENEETTSKYNIMSIPTLLLFDNGELKEQITGFKTKEELIELIEK